MSCKSLCRRHPHYTAIKKIEYAKGMKVCIACDRAIFVNIKGAKCPCCNKNLRTRPQYHGDKGRIAREATLQSKFTSY